MTYIPCFWKNIRVFLEIQSSWQLDKFHVYFCAVLHPVQMFELKDMKHIFLDVKINKVVLSEEIRKTHLKGRNIKRIYWENQT